MTKLSKREILENCIVIFEGMRRYASKGHAGLEAAKGAEKSFELDDAMVVGLKEWVRELQSGDVKRAGDKVTDIHDWQKKIMEEGVPERMTF